MCLDTKKCLSTYHRELVCPICLGLLCMDCVMDDNEHFYCKKCIFEWLRLGNTKCPIGNEPIEKEKLKSSRVIKSLLSDLQVTCSFDEKGCTSVIRYEELEKHEFECQFNIITCECGVKMQNSHKKTHICRLEVEKEKERELKQKLEQQAILKKKEWKFDNSAKFNSAFKKEYETFAKNSIKVITYNHMDPKLRLILIETCNPFYEYEGIKSSKSFHVPSKSLFTMAFQKTRRKILISDYMDKSLKIIDVNGSFLEKISQIGYLEKPWAISTNSRNEIFITDYEEKGIVKLDSNFKFSRKIGDKTIRNACYMALDPDNEDIMYLTHYIENKVSIWNVSDNKYINSFGIDTPEYIQIKRNKIFLTSRTEVEYIEGRKEFRRITGGSNCIFILNKSNYNILNAIRIDEWIDPRGLYVDDNLNILTTAFKLDEQNNRSDWRHLFVMNERKSCYTSLLLTGLEVLSDMLMIENRLYFCISDLVEIITLK